VTYCNKVIALTEVSSEKSQKLSAGLAHSTLGFAYLQQDKLAAAVPELKTAVSLLQPDPQAQQAALFRLGFAYAKRNDKADAVAALQKAAAIEGPYQALAKDMLAKVNAAGKK
jgi:tetratricopeptide (TPR) repeat protein